MSKEAKEMLFEFMSMCLLVLLLISTVAFAVVPFMWILYKWTEWWFQW